MKSKKILIIITALVMMLSLCIVASAAGSCSSNGDVTFDGKITTEDALKVLRFVSEIDTPTAAQRNAADIDGDGKITIDDVRCIMMVSANVIPAPGHSFSSWVTTKRATCTAEGKAVCICTVCGEEHTKTLPKTEHIYGSPDANGVSKCAVCGKTTGGSAEEPHTHEYKSWVTVKKATCTAEGQQMRECTVCGEKQYKSIAKSEHIYSSWSTVKKATCTAEGQIACRCTVCGAKQYKSLPKTEHSYTAPDANGVSKCTACGATKKEPVHTHEYSNWVTDKKATCSAEGKQVCECKICGAKQYKTLPKTDHIFTEWGTVTKATCTAEGKQARRCTVCGTEETKAIPKTEHITTTADCEHGSYCTVCNKQFSEPLGHDYKNGICQRCGSGMPIVEGDNYIYASGRQIFFGSSTSNITSLMGKPNDTFKINEHTFYVYSSNYNALVIVIFTDGKVTGVYTNADDVIICSGSSKETLSTAISRVTKVKDVKITYYTDNFAHNEKYAVLAEYGENDFGIYDVNSTAQAKLSFHITNGCRAINGIKPLKYNDKLGEVAYEHSADMGKRGYFSHVSPDGDDPKDRIINNNIIGACCGENIAAGYADAFVVTDAWYNSFDHRENVLDPEFTQLGVGVAYVKGSQRVYYYTQNFLG